MISEHPHHLVEHLSHCLRDGHSTGDHTPATFDRLCALRQEFRAPLPNLAQPEGRAVHWSRTLMQVIR